MITITTNEYKDIENIIRSLTEYEIVFLSTEINKNIYGSKDKKEITLSMSEKEVEQ